mmetsp:Transcript_16096/g.34787  ORF Transcript_16096/g.34787 Transcript_16096/m.34787 type:complete len:80 (+) Transcript_16096:123-362(+)
MSHIHPDGIDRQSPLRTDTLVGNVLSLILPRIASPTQSLLSRTFTFAACAAFLSKTSQSHCCIGFASSETGEDSPTFEG